MRLILSKEIINSFKFQDKDKSVEFPLSNTLSTLFISNYAFT